MSKIEDLRKFLSRLSPGLIPRDKEAELIRLLEISWDSLNPEASEDLYWYKLRRLEDPHWEPPFITFKIERHGGIGMGSTRAEMQQWNVKETV